MIRCNVCSSKIPKKHGFNELKFACCIRTYLDNLKREFLKNME